MRHLFERRLADVDAREGREALEGPAAAARQLLFGPPGKESSDDTSFALMHGLYWLAVNMSASRPLLIAVDDAQWADGPSLRWTAYLTARVDGLALGLMVASRPAERARRLGCWRCVGRPRRSFARGF